MRIRPYPVGLSGICAFSSSVDFKAAMRFHGFQPHLKLFDQLHLQHMCLFPKTIEVGVPQIEWLKPLQLCPIVPDLRSLLWFPCVLPTPTPQRMPWRHISECRCWAMGPNERLLWEWSRRTSVPIIECFRLWAQSCMLSCTLSLLLSIVG